MQNYSSAWPTWPLGPLVSWGLGVVWGCVGLVSGALRCNSVSGASPLRAPVFVFAGGFGVVPLALFVVCQLHSMISPLWRCYHVPAAWPATGMLDQINSFHAISHLAGSPLSSVRGFRHTGTFSCLLCLLPGVGYKYCMIEHAGTRPSHTL